jgi:hypothetical protein
VSRADYDAQLGDLMRGTNTRIALANHSMLGITIVEENPDSVDICWIFTHPPFDGIAEGHPRDSLEKISADLAHLGEMAPVFQQFWDPEKMRTDHWYSWPMRSLVVQQEDLEKLAEVGVMILGDAAHVMVRSPPCDLFIEPDQNN